MIQHTYYMKADQRSPTTTPIDILSAIGNWSNAKSDSLYLVRLAITEQDGHLMLRGYGANDPEPIDWGEVEAIPYIAGTSSRIAGFHAVYNLEGIETHLWGKYSQGVLAIQFNTRYLDGSGRSSHFAREFYYRHQ